MNKCFWLSYYFKINFMEKWNYQLNTYLVINEEMMKTQLIGLKAIFFLTFTENQGTSSKRCWLPSTNKGHYILRYTMQYDIIKYYINKEWNLQYIYRCQIIWNKLHIHICRWNSTKVLSQWKEGIFPGNKYSSSCGVICEVGWLGSNVTSRSWLIRNGPACWNK